MAAMSAASLVPHAANAPVVAQARPSSASKPTERMVLKFAIEKALVKPAPQPVIAKQMPDEAVPGADEDAKDPDAKPVPAQALIAQDAELDKQSGDIAERVQARVPHDLMPYFDVFLYVSKAASGPWAQHLFIFHRGDNGELVYERNFPVSTGRERHEKYFTSTPAGIFELDPNRFEPMHYSHTWHNAPMAWAMFFNASYKFRQVGIALHSAGPHIAELGQRASGGCVRLPPQEADILFHRFQASERGQVPVLTVDQATGTTSRTGEVMRGPTGLPLMAPGYRVLLLIEDYPGGPALVAVLS